MSGDSKTLTYPRGHVVAADQIKINSKENNVIDLEGINDSVQRAILKGFFSFCPSVHALGFVYNARQNVNLLIRAARRARNVLRIEYKRSSRGPQLDIGCVIIIA
jgi:hypothetical protein